MDVTYIPRKASKSVRWSESRLSAAPRARTARSFISKRWSFLAVTELIEAEVAHHEAEATKRAVEALSAVP